MIPFPEAVRTWARVACLSFGGPAGQIAVMHRIVVDEKKWVDDERFARALNFCMLLPGPEAQQLATYLGWLMHGVKGGLVAGLLFVAPGAIAVYALSVVYALHHDVAGIEALFYGLKPAVLAIVVQAVIRIGKRILKNRVMDAIAAATFAALFLFHVPYPWIVVAAALVGVIGSWLAPAWFQVLRGHGSPSTTGTAPQLPLRDDVPPTWGRAIAVCAIFLPLWFGPVMLLRQTLGHESAIVQQSVFFSKTAVVTFGGAYSVLSYVAQQAVERYHWLTAEEMLDGLGLAETTPGPLIMVVQFVAFLGAYRHPGGLSPLTAATLGSVVTLWVTFVPCFFWIFLGAPYIERLKNNRSLAAALSAITAAVVGVILHLAVWFAIHVMFADTFTWDAGPLSATLPELASIRWPAVMLALAAAALAFIARASMWQTLAACAAGGLVCGWLGWC